MGLTSFNRLRRQRAGTDKLEHNEAEKILTTENQALRASDVAEKNAEVIQDAQRVEDEKARKGIVNDSDTPEETQAKNKRVVKDAQAAVKVRKSAETIEEVAAIGNDTPEEVEAKSQLVIEDAEQAEQVKEETAAEPVSDQTPNVNADANPATGEEQTAAPEEPAAEAPKRGRKKSDS